MGFRILEKIGVALGNKKVDNTYFLNQVEEEQRNSLLHYYEDISGKDIRYMADATQTSVSLACQAAIKALGENGISGEEIDMVIFISQTPEYISPTMARYVVEAIEGREDIRYFDMNQNCTGMLVALDIADQYFESDSSMKYTLIVQGDCPSKLNIEKTSPFFGVLSDIGCAIILERSETSGIKNKNFKLLKYGLESIVYPKDGYSKPDEVLYTMPGLDPGVEVGVQVIMDKLNQAQLEEVKVFCISQFALSSYNTFAEITQIPKEKIPYIGDRYGYTGASSPILALKEGIEQGTIKRGDDIILWTYGAGIQHAMIEMIY